MNDTLIFDRQTGVKFEVNTETRTIRGLAVPFDVVGNNGYGAYRFTKDSLDWAKVKLLEQHDWSQAIGTVALTVTDEGLEMTAKVAPGARGDQHLGPDAVGRQHEHRPLHVRGHAHDAAERAQVAHRERRAGARHQLDDAPLGLVRRGQRDACRRIPVAHGVPPSPWSKWTRSRKPRTRASTSSRSTPSQRRMPNSSTANDPIAAP